VLVNRGLGLVTICRRRLAFLGHMFALRRSVVPFPDALVDVGGIFMYLRDCFISDGDAIRAICAPSERVQQIARVGLLGQFRLTGHASGFPPFSNRKRT
jgi:hypothetical protein